MSLSGDGDGGGGGGGGGIAVNNVMSGHIVLIKTFSRSAGLYFQCNGCLWFELQTAYTAVINT